MLKKILIVDDSEFNRQMLSEMLKDKFEILQAENGKEALEILMEKYEVISVVLLDIVMPIMNGYETLKKISELPVLANIPVIVTTGSNQEGAETKVLSLGASDYVQKPYSRDTMIHRINNTIKLHENASIINAMQKDDLTGLYNRKGFFDRAAKMVNSKPKGYYVMACFDIDNFKVINDQYGNVKGDEVLRQVAEAFATGFEPVDGICGRITADNFVILYPVSFLNTEGLSQIRENAKRLDGTIPPISFSIGRYIVDDLSLSGSAMYDRASMARKSIKGRYDVSTALYDEKMRTQILHEQQIVSEMKPALENRNFEVWFQPQYNHATGALIGAEALVRWRHPKGGLISPGDFIPVFERNGFIYALDKYVWETVCVTLRRWIDEKRSPLPVSVNISRFDLLCDDLVDVIIGLMEKYEIPVNLLRLEITESAFAKSGKEIITIVTRLIDYGFVVEVDDFGSGYSSLNTLKEVPAQILKLDMKFLESTGDSERGGNIVESVVRMAKWIGMSVIAEGVETKKQADFLKSIGCIYIQGFLYSKPIPMEEYENIAKHKKKEEEMLVLETVENLDNNRFWDPNSLDTLIFNSYVGGASIFEYTDGNIELIRVSEKYLQIIGSSEMTTEDVLALSWMDYLDEENQQTVRNALKKSVETGTEITAEYTFLGLPGCPSKTYIRTSMRVIARSGERHMVYCINQNITAQREAEEKARESTSQLAAITMNINGGVTAVRIDENEKPNFIYANNQYYSMLGYTREEFEREKINAFDLLYHEDKKRVIEQTMEINKTGKSTSCVYRVVHSSGRLLWIESNISVTKIRGVDGVVQIAVARDITEQRKLEQRSAENAERLQVIMDNVDSGVVASVIGKNKLQIILANNRYYEMLGYTKQEYEAAFTGSNGPILVDEIQEVLRKSEKAIRNKENMVLEYRAMHKDGKIIWLRQSSTITEFIGISGNVQLSVFTDITEDKESERKILESSEQLNFLNETAHELLAHENAEDGIENVLRRTLGYFGADRAFIFEYNYEEETCSNSYEIYAPGLRSYKHKYRNFPLNYAWYWLKTFESSSFFYLSDADTLGDDRSGERGVYETMGVNSVLAVSLRSGDRVIGTMGVFNPTCHLNNYTDLSAIGDYVAVILTRRNLNTKIMNDKLYFLVLMDDMPGGFARMRIGNDKIPYMDYANNRFCEMRGMTREEVMSDENRNALLSVHPDDIEAVRDFVFELIESGERRSIKYRLMKSDNQYIWVIAYARISRNVNDMLSINAYFAEVSDEEKKELSFKETLPFVLNAIMHSTTDLTFAKDANLNYICCSNAFAKMAGFESEKDIIGKTDFDLFGSELANKYHEDDERLLNDGKSLIDMVERIPSYDGITHYSSTSKHLLRDTLGNIIGLYGVGRDITQYRTAFEHLKLVTDNTPCGLAIFEISPFSLRVAYYNDGFYDYSGYSREEFEAQVKKNPMSLVYDEDVLNIRDAIESLRRGETTVFECNYRCHKKDGGYRYFSAKGIVSDKRGNTLIINYVKFDITERTAAEDKLRMSEEQLRIAIGKGGRVVSRYDIKTDTYYDTSNLLASQNLAKEITDIPQAFFDSGIVMPGCRDDIIAYFDNIRNGKQDCSIDVALKISEREYRWFHCDATVVYDSSGEPSQAVLVFNDITEQREKETIYRKWQQSLRERTKDSYTLFRCNLSKSSSFDSMEGELLKIKFIDREASFDERTHEYVSQFVHPEDRSKYEAVLNTDTMLANFYRGVRTASLEYREVLSPTETRWLLLSVDLVEYPDSKDVEIYMMYENIDEKKKAERIAQELAENDPLTGALNRAAFIKKMNKIMNISRAGAKHALMMIDLDGFKQINDKFGHAAGDQVLIEITNTLRSALRQNDLLGRLGGDEFVIFLCDIPDDDIAVKKAMQICSQTRKSYGVNATLSASIGIAISPRDGLNFDLLYNNVDAALYYVKETGKDNFAFYNDKLFEDVNKSEKKARTTGFVRSREKRRMLIVDDNDIILEMLSYVFRSEFIIEKAGSGDEALEFMSRYGESVSIVLLDLYMPGTDGFAVLEKMHSSKALQNIPVIVVSGDNERETSMKAIKYGASDYITKPIDLDLIRLRVYSVISRAENERLCEQNKMLIQKEDEVVKYRVVLENTGTVLIEYDSYEDKYTYDSLISKYIAGTFDDRQLGEIFISDEVASEEDVKLMMELLGGILSEHDGMKCSGMKLRLRTPANEWHSFYLNVFKRSNKMNHSEKIIMSFKDIDAEL